MPTATPNHPTTQSEAGTAQIDGAMTHQDQEYEVPVSQLPQQAANDSPYSAHRAQMPSTPTPQSRSLRPHPSHGRPVSMPPQAYNLNLASIGAGPSTGRSTPVTSNSSDPVRGQPDDTPRRREGTGKSSRSGNKILGDYTLSKLLGAGSMGKVKLAVHNVTGEKVRSFSLNYIYERSIDVGQLFSLPSKYFLESTLHHLPTETIRRPFLSRPPKMPPRRSVLCAKPLFHCYSTTRTSAACAK
jgi:hypothetical protein